MNSAPPVWLLDFDGVLNSNRPGWGGPPRTRNVLGTDGHFYKVRWAPALVDRLRALHLSGRVELRWATTWAPVADRLEAELRLPALPRALTAEEAAAGNSALEGKRAAARRVVVDEGRKLVWSDDEVIPEHGELRDLLDSAGALLLVPRSNRGLREEHLEQVEAWLAALEASA